MLSGILISVAKTEEIYTVEPETNLEHKFMDRGMAATSLWWSQTRSLGGGGGRVAVCGLGLPNRAELDSDAAAGQLAS